MAAELTVPPFIGTYNSFKQLEGRVTYGGLSPGADFRGSLTRQLPRIKMRACDWTNHLALSHR